jgi:phosphatidylglycerophosphate synthase
MSTGVHTRVNRGVLADAEKRLLVSIATRLPQWVNSDHLSALGLFSMIGVGLSFWGARVAPEAGLPLVVVFLFLNWFGDSLDGTVARVRNRQRPRYGFYVDHVIDLAGTSVMIAGMGLGGLMSPLVTGGVLCAWLLVAAESFLSTHARGVFTMSFGRLGPTELRVVVAVVALSVLRSPWVDLPLVGPALVFDVVGVPVALGLVAAFFLTSLRNGWALYVEETSWRSG